MQVSKKQGRFLDSTIEQWQKCDLISEEQSLKLKQSYDAPPFDWQRLAKYAFWLAIVCIVISVSSALADKWLIQLLEKLFNAPNSVKCITLSLLAALLYGFGIHRKRHRPEKVYSNEAILFLGVSATATAILFLGKVIDTGSGHFSLLMLLAAIIYGLLGLWFPSKLVWVASLISLGSWFGAETGYASGWGAYYLGMNYPLRFVLFGLVLIVFGKLVFSSWPARQAFLRPTRAMGLLYLFIALWILSIFGNYGDYDSWEAIKQIGLLHWSLLFGIAALTAIYHGIQYEDQMTKGFGLTFIFINLYTRFFEFFWDGTHKALFFAILGLSFWLLGSKAEKIWQLNLKKS